MSAGFYEKKQILCESSVISWSHQARFRTALSLVSGNPQGKLLDYGCGDGTFLSLIKNRFDTVVGADIDENVLAHCRERFANDTKVDFVHSPQIRSMAPESFAVICCTEVLEHVPEEHYEVLLSDFERLLTRDGRLILSVPIEVGASLLIKELFRVLAAWRKLGDYSSKETYSLRELFTMGVRCSPRGIVRPIYETASGKFHGHKGFDWRRLEEKLRSRFVIEKRIYSPLPLAPWFLNSQVWFQCSSKTSQSER
jgi:ubiquinone/menaquinone biosynthesis C-methylase UbiE